MYIHINFECVGLWTAEPSVFVLLSQQLSEIFAWLAQLGQLSQHPAEATLQAGWDRLVRAWTFECHSGTWWYGHLDIFCWLRLYSLYKSCMDYNVYFIVICIEVEETYIITLNSHYTWCNDKWLVNKEINVRRKVQWSIALLSKIPGRFSPPSQWLGQFQVPHQSIPTRLELQLSSFVLSLMKVYTWKFEVSPSDETFGTKGGFSFLLYTSSQSMPAKQKTIFLQFDHFLFTFEPFVIFDVISTVF